MNNEFLEIVSLKENWGISDSTQEMWKLELPCKGNTNIEAFLCVCINDIIMHEEMIDLQCGI